MNRSATGPGAAALGAADRVLRQVEFATVLIAGAVIFFVMWVGVAEIFSRKLFNYPLYGQLDIIELTMSSYAILPISYCWRAAGHIRVDLVIDHFRRPPALDGGTAYHAARARAGDGDLARRAALLRQRLGDRRFHHQYPVADLAVEVRADRRVFDSVGAAGDRDCRLRAAGPRSGR